MTTTTTGTTTLTQLRLNPRHAEVERDLRDAGRMHRRVMSLLPHDLGTQARAAAGALYRVEHQPTGAVVLIQAHHQPNLAELPADYADAATHQLDPLLARLTSGLTVQYRILANPTSIKTTDDKRKTRHWLRGDDALAWWHRRAEQAGLQLHTALLTSEQVISTTRNTGPRPQRISHGTSQFDGTATITDPSAARHSVLTGIGRARAYGCGLLSLAPSQS